MGLTCLKVFYLNQKRRNLVYGCTIINNSIQCFFYIYINGISVTRNCFFLFFRKEKTIHPFVKGIHFVVQPFNSKDKQQLPSPDNDFNLDVEQMLAVENLAVITSAA